MNCCCSLPSPLSLSGRAELRQADTLATESTCLQPCNPFPCVSAHALQSPNARMRLRSRPEGDMRKRRTLALVLVISLAVFGAGYVNVRLTEVADWLEFRNQWNGKVWQPGYCI